jgi:hypothetical protein
MSFYDLSKEERIVLSEKINRELFSEINNGERNCILKYFSDEDTYIRKVAYNCFRVIAKNNKHLLNKIIILLDSLFISEDAKVRQTVINAAGEIGKFDFTSVEHLMNKGLFDVHHSVRNAVIGSIKKMGEKNPKHVLAYAKQYLHHPDKEIRREICHGIELRGRTHPQDILPMLRELQWDKTPRVRNTLIHVLGQIAYKKGCLATVTKDLQTWENKELVKEALDEIIDVHDRYRNFAVLSQEEARQYIGSL